MIDSKKEEEQNEPNGGHMAVLGTNMFLCTMLLGYYFLHCVSAFVQQDYLNAYVKLSIVFFIVSFLYFATFPLEILTRTLGLIYSSILLVFIIYEIIDRGQDKYFDPRGYGIWAFFTLYFFLYFLLSNRCYSELRLFSDGHFMKNYINPYLILFSILFGGILIGVYLRS